jgi:putative ATP-dependent endonuclease of the OLD family
VQAEARNTALGQLLGRTVRSKVNFKNSIENIRVETQQKYRELLDGSQSQLEEISSTLRNRLVEWAHEDATLKLKWHQEPEKAVSLDEPFAQAILGEAGFEGELTQFGHGLQRSFILALLQELSGSDVKGGPRLLLACEEPELYQHPPQARHLYNLLLNLSEQNSEILVTTHSPYFLSGEGFESVRLVRKVNSGSTITRTTYAAISEAIASAKGEPPLKVSGQLAKIHQALQPGLSEMFFASKILFVEGIEDSAYLTTYLHLMGLWDEYRRLGCCMIPTHGKSEMLQPIAVAQKLRIPAFVIFDADGDKLDKSGSEEKHRKDNVAILSLCGVSKPEAFPSEIFWGDNVITWPYDIGCVVEDDVGKDDWTRCRAEADKKYGHAGNLQKNALHISSCLQLAWEAGKKSPSLEKASQKLIYFAKANG